MAKKNGKLNGHANGHDPRARPKLTEDIKPDEIVQEIRTDDPSFLTDPMLDVTPDIPQIAARPGRPTKFRPEFVDLARKCCFAFGATDEELATFFSVSVESIDNWKNQYPEFADAIRVTKAMVDANAVVKLYQRATGYSHADEKIVVVDGQVQRIATTRHYPPDTLALKYWLNNRQPHNWKERVEHTGPDGSAPIKIESLSDAQLEILIQRLQKVTE